MISYTESEIEIFFLSELKQLGFSYIPGPSIEARQTGDVAVGQPQGVSPYHGGGTCNALRRIYLCVARRQAGKTQKLQ